MTVSYNHLAKYGFFRLLFRWRRGQILKLLWLDLTILLILYYIFNMSYRFGMNPQQKSTFKAVVKYFSTFGQAVPLKFILQFYASVVITRWQTYIDVFPFPDTCAMYLSMMDHSMDDRGRLLRRTIIRYWMLATVHTFRDLSPAVCRRFPKMDFEITEGILTQDEHDYYQGIFNDYHKYPTTLLWAAWMTTRSYKIGRINDSAMLALHNYEYSDLRAFNGKSFLWDGVATPLVYPQVVSLAVYMHFFFSILGAQNLDDINHNVALVVPWVLVCDFIVYFGMLKVCEVMVSPYGDDDDDFEINGWINRAFTWPVLIIEEVYRHMPEMARDEYWDNVQFIIPHTEASAVSAMHTSNLQVGSANHVKVTGRQSEFRGSTVVWNDERHKTGLDKSTETKDTDPKSTRQITDTKNAQKGLSRPVSPVIVTSGVSSPRKGISRAASPRPRDSRPNSARMRDIVPSPSRRYGEWDYDLHPGRMMDAEDDAPDNDFGGLYGQPTKRRKMNTDR